MAKRLIVVCKCPICGEMVDQIPDGVLKLNPHHNNCEMVVTRSGYKQYIHTSCWNEMIREKRPYNGKLYV